jgi:hypothetical protein
VTPIPIIGVTGEYASGKTLFGLTIDPERTKVYDFEKSSVSYRALGFEHVDAVDVMQLRHPGGFKPVELWNWWREDARSIPAGRYSVVMLDPISELENGLAEWVAANPKHFGKTPGQYQRMSGLFWNDVKTLWKQVLSEVAAKCHTLVLVAHMKQIWAGEKPTGKKTPKGKTSIEELASLYLQMERVADARGNPPAEPSARVRKSRLMHAGIDPETGRPRIVPALPPRLPVATPDAIREYQRNPPDYRKLKAAERAPEVTLSEDDRLALRLQLAETEREAEATRLERLGREDRREVLPARAQGEPPPAPPGPAADPVPPAACPPGAPVRRAEGEAPAPVERLALLRARLFELAMPGAAPEDTQPQWLKILGKYSVATARDLDAEQLHRLSGDLEAKIATLELEEKFGGGGAAAEAPFRDG